MALDLCVVSYNTRDLLVRLRDTLAEYSPNENFTLYIADNGSTDGTKEWLLDPLRDKEYGLPWLKEPAIGRVVINQNIGYAAAANQLAAMGTGEIIGILNADVWLEEEDVKQILESFEDRPDQAIMGPKQRDEQGKIRHGGIFGPNTKLTQRGWGEFDPGDKLYKDVSQCTTVSGSAYFIRRSVWEDLAACPIHQKLNEGAPYQGAFLNTPHYYEETWCSYHAGAHGYKVYYDGTISIGHTWKASCSDDAKLRKYFQVSRQVFKHACETHGIEHDIR